jgi:WD40 repeat protein
MFSVTKQETIGLDFSDDGNHVLCNIGNRIELFNINDEPRRANESNECARNAKFHIGMRSILAMHDKQIKYYDHHEQKTLLTFPGHQAPIISMSPSKSSPDHFGTTSSDCMIKIWDLRMAETNATMSFIRKFSPVIACNPVKKEYAVASVINTWIYVEIFQINLIQTLRKFNICTEEGIKLSGLSYSNDGQYLMVATRNAVIYVLNAETGRVKHNLQGFDNSRSLAIDACFSPCSQFVASGSENSRIHFWNLNSSEKIAVLKCTVRSPFRKIAFNPKFMCMASAGGGNFYIWVENDATTI